MIILHISDANILLLSVKVKISSQKVMYLNEFLIDFPCRAACALLLHLIQMVNATINLWLTCAHAIFGERCAVITSCTIISLTFRISTFWCHFQFFFQFFLKFFLGLFTYFNYFEACSDRKTRLDFVLNMQCHNRIIFHWAEIRDF